MAKPLSDEDLRERVDKAVGYLRPRGTICQNMYTVVHAVAQDMREACREVATQTLAARSDVRVSVTVAVDKALRALPPHEEATDGKAV